MYNGISTGGGSAAREARERLPLALAAVAANAVSSVPAARLPGAPAPGTLTAYVSDLTALHSSHKCVTKDRHPPTPVHGQLPLQLPPSPWLPVAPPSDSTTSASSNGRASGQAVLRQELLSPAALFSLFQRMWRAFWRYYLQEGRAWAARQAASREQLVQRYVELVEAVLAASVGYLEPGLEVETHV